MNAMPLPGLEAVSDGHLTARLYELRSQERALLVEFLRYLAELDRRRLYLEAGYPSLFAFCTEYLGLTSSSAFRRTTAARLLARFPVVATYLADGRLCLTTLVELRDVLEESRLDEVLGRAAGRTEQQVKELVAAMRPRPAPPEMLRRLPTPTANDNTAVPQRTVRPEPISEDLRVLRMTVTREFVADLEAVKAALSHQIWDGNIAQLLHQCMRMTLETCERRRRGSGKARDTGASRSRYVPAAIRDQVWRRDEGQCAFVSTDGHRCRSTHQVELHHLVAFARGGMSSLENLSLRCRKHNAFHAEQDFGAAHIELARQGSLW
jgi:5-methylcytosine-specific restriction endonuclease McrA